MKGHFYLNGKERNIFIFQQVEPNVCIMVCIMLYFILFIAGTCFSGQQ